jgi:hypothetical protein
VSFKPTAKQLAQLKRAAQRKPKPVPKTFKVDWIPEAAGRKLVRMFATIVYAYRDQAGKRIDNLSMAYAPDGITIHFTLYTNPEQDLDRDERKDEPDPPALDSPPELRKKD